MLTTHVDKIFDLLKEKKVSSLLTLSKEAQVPFSAATKIVHYLEEAGIVAVSYNQAGPRAQYVKDPRPSFKQLDVKEVINKLKFFKSMQDFKSANKLVIDLYDYYKRIGDAETARVYAKVREYYQENFLQDQTATTDAVKTLESYNYEVERLSVDVDIVQQPLEPVPFYLLSLLKISDSTKVVIDQIKERVVGKILANISPESSEELSQLRKQYEVLVTTLMQEVFTDFSDEELSVFSNYVIITSLGMGEIEFLLHDSELEEVVVNNSYEPVRVYHKKYGWVETNIIPESDDRIVHYATLAGRNVEKTITTLQPLMDAHLRSGDRVNATLSPVSTKGSTITIRKFSEDPWTITDFLQSGTIDYTTAAMVWTAIQYELSVLIVGGTGSGKTSALNVFSLFIVPSQRVLSIEDTRELRLPSTLHWVPLETRSENTEGKGEVSMLDLLVNALRMRPDRIIVGEIRRKKEAEVLFEAMHTGHSVYATLHANTVEEAVVRLTTEPIGISKTLLGALDLIIVQNRNRRTNQRRTFQLAEVLPSGDVSVLYGYKFASDALEEVNPPKEFYNRMELFSGLTQKEVDASIAEKVRILKYLVEEDIKSIEQIGQIISEYYIDRDYLLNRLFGKKEK